MAIDGSLDALLLCGRIAPEFGKLIPLMATNGTIYVLTIDFSLSSVPSLALIDRGLSIKGSHVTSMPAMHEMIRFCVDKDVSAEMQRYPFTTKGVNNALKALKEGSIRYKAVLCTDL